ncbi:hypothetical protein AX774_g2366 [Zancudomyces culisetae]|uniref:Putative zinc-finger domain-containing protein n=1 Tax=Zancudomyces culisetae TaxID=1213189 RepID=A0A1R1PSZ5_ZANCU|nr:hypothetical protein AX774_g2366 [Zancudomyces culisetae]|eukprot:OMH84115.1 hypothetical protein AX774_g2366 [Zancudomyces culisetae]
MGFKEVEIMGQEGLVAEDTYDYLMRRGESVAKSSSASVFIQPDTQYAALHNKVYNLQKYRRYQSPISPMLRMKLLGKSTFRIPEARSDGKVRKLEKKKMMCEYELSGGMCNDDSCQSMHAEDYSTDKNPINAVLSLVAGLPVNEASLSECLRHYMGIKNVIESIEPKYVEPAILVSTLLEKCWRNNAINNTSVECNNRDSGGTETSLDDSIKKKIQEFRNVLEKNLEMNRFGGYMRFNDERMGGKKRGKNILNESRKSQSDMYKQKPINKRYFESENEIEQDEEALENQQEEKEGKKDIESNEKSYKELLDIDEDDNQKIAEYSELKIYTDENSEFDEENKSGGKPDGGLMKIDDGVVIDFNNLEIESIGNKQEENGGENGYGFRKHEKKKKMGKFKKTITLGDLTTFNFIALFENLDSTSMTVIDKVMMYQVYLYILLNKELGKNYMIDNKKENKTSGNDTSLYDFVTSGLEATIENNNGGSSEAGMALLLSVILGMMNYKDGKKNKPMTIKSSNDNVVGDIFIDYGQQDIKSVIVEDDDNYFLIPKSMEICGVKIKGKVLVMMYLHSPYFMTRLLVNYNCKVLVRLINVLGLMIVLSLSNQANSNDGDDDIANNKIGNYRISLIEKALVLGIMALFQNANSGLNDFTDGSMVGSRDEREYSSTNHDEYQLEWKKRLLRLLFSIINLKDSKRKDESSSLSNLNSISTNAVNTNVSEKTSLENSKVATNKKTVLPTNPDDFTQYEKIRWLGSNEQDESSENTHLEKQEQGKRCCDCDCDECVIDYVLEQKKENMLILMNRRLVKLNRLYQEYSWMEKMIMEIDNLVILN